MYRTRRWWASTLATSLAVAAVMGAWVAAHPQVQAAVARGEIRQLVQNDFAAYYSEYAASSFAAQVWTNNAWVAALCIAFGVLGVPVVYVLFQNVANLGLVGGLMAAGGRLELFFGLILPHGLLELTAVFVAAAPGCGCSGHGSTRPAHPAAALAGGPGSLRRRHGAGGRARGVGSSRPS